MHFAAVVGVKVQSVDLAAQFVELAVGGCVEQVVWSLDGDGLHAPEDHVHNVCETPAQSVEVVGAAQLVLVTWPVVVAQVPVVEAAVIVVAVAAVGRRKVVFEEWYCKNHL